MAATTSPPPGPSLKSLRWLLFAFFGGIGGLLPFLPLHARAIGLTIDEVKLISILSPIITFIGPAIAGPLVDHCTAKKKKEQSKEIKLDNNASIRRTLSSTIFLAGLFYSLLLTVPEVQRFPPSQPDVSFECAEQGAYLLQEQCNEMDGCYQYPAEKVGAIRLTNCVFDCSSGYHYDFLANENDDKSLETEVKPTTVVETGEISPETTTEVNSAMALEPDMDKFFGTDDELDENDDEDAGFDGSGEYPSDWLPRRRREKALEEALPPHICFGPSAKKMCSVYTPYSPAIVVNISLRQGHGIKDFCLYPLGGQVSCRIPPIQKNPTQTCKVNCDLEDAFVTGSILQQSQCIRTIGDPDLTFWLYFVIRTLADVFTAISISLLIGATLSAVRIQIGQEFLAPTVAYALFSSLAGYLQCEDMAHLESINKGLPPYFFGIFFFGLLSVISVFIVMFSTEMPIGPPDWWSTSRHIRFRHKAEFFAVLLILTLLGILWGPQFNHVPWHLEGTIGVEAYVGWSPAIGAILSLPFVWKVDFIIDYCGFSNLLITAFTFYILRYSGLLFIKHPWILFVIGGFDVFTLSLMMFSSILYIRHLVPKHLTFTAQSLGFAAHFCLGNGFGNLIATLLEVEWSEDVLLLSNRTSIDEFDEAWDSPYHLIYCSGALFAAVVASIYFIVYHCCLKKKCLAPPYRKSASAPPLVQGSSGNGTYTPLRVFHNGHQQQTD